MKESFVNLNNASRRENEKYKRVIEGIKRDGVCPFCPENLRRYHKKPILKRGRHWLLTDNMYPYGNAKHHILLIHRSHIENISDLSRDAWRELFSFFRVEVGKRKIGGGTFYLRFGNTNYTGASVSHLHAHLISPDIKNKNRKPTMARVG